jgi:hypothetical protein
VAKVQKKKAMHYQKLVKSYHFLAKKTGKSIKKTVRKNPQHIE